MEALTQQLWELQNRHQGDRFRFFTAVSTAVEADRVLYPGSFVDVAASMVFDDVTYVDVDKRFPKFFADEAGVNEIIDASRDHAGPVLRACCARRLPGRSRHRRRVRRPAGGAHQATHGMAEQDDRHSDTSHLCELVFDIVEETLETLNVALGAFGRAVASLVDGHGANTGGGKLAPQRLRSARSLGHDVREGWFEGLDEVFGSGNAVRILRDVTYRAKAQSTSLWSPRSCSAKPVWA
ncbi:hypothetical protein GQR58_029231 [Nymphon striatum]|nr:hypothetical protein GQR58_029231 [Nymphon striatum]